MTKVRDKIFRDPIYGYISISEKYCEDFIDTPIFQRLRRIEQTSMRILYPAAHHDRFIHSLGVFYLGKTAFSHLEANSRNFFSEITQEQWDKYRTTFEIACLMHDCGHSPFSHTFEDHYLFQKEENIKNQILSYFENEPAFSKEYDSASPASHEKISALLLLSVFFEKIKTYSASPQLAARMIMGCKYESPKNLFEKFENRLISLLNGSGIDVDSLDYIQRDSWISGVSNVEIDYQRLLSSIMIKPDDHGRHIQIVFKKGALSVLENISLGRNFLYKWIYSHHIVTYEQELLKNIIKKINMDSGNELNNKIFSIEAFTNPVSFLGVNYYLPSDDDIMHIIKSSKEPNPCKEEFLSRKYRYKALWKTYFEFKEVYFKDVNDENRMRIRSHINNDKLSEKYGKEKFLCLSAKPKLKGINPNNFFIDIDSKLIDAAKAISFPSQNLDYFMLYVSPDLSSRKKDILEDILGMQA
ncbi:dGTP triphosphohydrolase [Bacteroidia bacterium]|nr:dGTP triphosphohydrolase [Bacteroidia bacterium]